MDKKVSVVLADDHQLFIEGLKRILAETGKFNIQGTATNGEELVKMVKKNPPDIVITDLNMPKMDGQEAIKEILKWNKKVKIIALTMYDDLKIVKSTIKAGCNAYLLKSRGKKELFEGIEAALDGNLYVSDVIEFDKPKKSLKKASTKFDDIFIRKYHLTKREKEVLGLISEAKSNKEIGKELYISYQTVSVHRKNIMRKLGVSNTAGLIKIAYDNSLI